MLACLFAACRPVCLPVCLPAILPVCVCVPVHMHVRLEVCVCMSLWMYCMRVYVCVSVCLRVCVSVCLCVCVSVCVCACFCLRTYMYLHTLFITTYHISMCERMSTSIRSSVSSISTHQLCRCLRLVAHESNLCMGCCEAHIGIDMFVVV